MFLVHIQKARSLLIKFVQVFNKVKVQEQSFFVIWLTQIPNELVIFLLVYQILQKRFTVILTEFWKVGGSMNQMKLLYLPTLFVQK